MAPSGLGDPPRRRTSAAAMIGAGGFAACVLIVVGFAIRGLVRTAGDVPVVTATPVVLPLPTAPAKLDPFAPPANGASVVLGDGNGVTVLLSNSAERWGDAERVANLPNGTRARVLSRREFVMGDAKTLRYEIETLGGGAKRHGWVHGFAVHQAVDGG